MAGSGHGGGGHGVGSDQTADGWHSGKSTAVPLESEIRKVVQLPHKCPNRLGMILLVGG